MDNVTEYHIAPCGMNCRLCIAFQREKKACRGCKGPDEYKPAHCISCTIKNCGKFAPGKHDCSSCEKKCVRIKELDKRYRTKYSMSMLDNLLYIKEKGMDAFLQLENTRRRCPDCGNIICIHKKDCPQCKTEKLTESAGNCK